MIDRLTRRFGAWPMAAMSTPQTVNTRAVRIIAHSPQRTASRLAAVAAPADALMPSTGLGRRPRWVVCRAAAVSVEVPWNSSSLAPSVATTTSAAGLHTAPAPGEHECPHRPGPSGRHGTWLEVG
jgi:hypothetical protein